LSIQHVEASYSKPSAWGANSLAESPAGNAIVFTGYARSGIRWYLTELPVMMSYELEARVSRIAQPVLVVRGSRDPVAPRSWCQKLAAIAAHGRFLEIQGKPHIVQHGAATRMAAGILAFTRS
jgi:pimeloyl-ACP methyl ester carboxylesterase